MGIVGGPPTVRPTTQRKKSTKLPSTMLILVWSPMLAVAAVVVVCTQTTLLPRRLSFYPCSHASLEAGGRQANVEVKAEPPRPCSAAVTECKTASYGEGRPQQDLFLSRRSMKPCPVVLVGEPAGATWA